MESTALYMPLFYRLKDACISNPNDLNGSQLETTLFQWLFPVLAGIGVIGNLLNMLILLETKVTRAYLLFILIALSDILFFFALSPAWLASYPVFAENITFRYLFFAVKIHFYGFANWISGFNTWTVCLVSLERFVAVRYPLRVNWMREAGMTNKRVIGMILAVTFACTSYIHFSTQCKTKLICQGTQLMQGCMDVLDDWTLMTGRQNPAPVCVRQMIVVLRYLHAIVAIIVPLGVVTIVNGLLLRHVHSEGFAFGDSENENRVIKLDDFKSSSSQQLVFRRHSERRGENRITAIAFLSITLYIVTHLPSALLLAYRTMKPINSNQLVYNEGINNYDTQVICSFLSMGGKVVNFVLFCALSGNFRRILRDKFCCCRGAEKSTSQTNRANV